MRRSRRRSTRSAVPRSSAAGTRRRTETRPSPFRPDAPAPRKRLERAFCCPGLRIGRKATSSLDDPRRPVIGYGPMPLGG
jgi:hypothetical protein